MKLRRIITDNQSLLEFLHDSGLTLQQISDAVMSKLYADNGRYLSHKDDPLAKIFDRSEAVEKCSAWYSDASDKRVEYPEPRPEPVKERIHLRLPDLKEIVAGTEQELKDCNQSEDSCPVSIIKTEDGAIIYKVIH